MNDPVPTRIPLADRSADEVRLRGTFNLPLSSEQQRTIVRDAARVLKPAGRLFVHVLVGESPVENPVLPGPAGAVRSVPFEADPIALVENAGFVGVRMLKFGSTPCYVRDGVAMRELQLEGFVPAESPAESAVGDVEVMYRGPFREVSDELGTVFSRGHRITVSGAIAKRLRSSELADQFVLFERNPSRPATATPCGR